MSIAVAEYLLAYDTLMNPFILSDMFVNTFKANPIKGYSRGFQTLLEEVKTGKEFYERLLAHGRTDKNGAVMRSVPCGFIKDIGTLLEFTAFQAGITHEGTGVLGAQAVALATWYFRNLHGKPENLPEFLNDTLHQNIVWEWAGSVEAKVDLGLITAKAAIFAVLGTSTLHDLLIQSVAYCGDVDTVAAVAMGIGSQSIYHEQNLPESLKHGLRNDAFGKSYLEALDKKLAEKFA
jgi:ADP-ribosyl-[dinitrogen reductase] hydrolase